MILTDINKCIRYTNMIPGLSDILNQVSNIKEALPGRYDTEYGFYMIQKGSTISVSAGLFETHKKYIDLQIMLEGSEELVWADSDKLKIYSEYDDRRDSTLYKGNGKIMKIDKDMCYILFPEDAHMACVHSYKKEDYLKLVYKIKL